MGRRTPEMAPERREGKQGTMGRLVNTRTILPRTNNGHDLYHITNLQHQPNRTNPARNTTLDSTKALETRNSNKEDKHNQTTVKWNQTGRTNFFPTKQPPIEAETSLPSIEQSRHLPQTQPTRPIPASTTTKRTPPGLQRHTK